MSAKRDYYEVLGIPKDASQADVKSQYRKMALKFHPDRNKTAEAAEHFKEISEAYAVLSDAKKRQLYDSYGHKGVDSQYSTEDIFQGARGSFSDIFSDLFGREGGFESFFGGFGQNAGQRRGRDMVFRTSLTLEEVLRGKKVELEVRQNVACSECRATGCAPGSSPKRCETCGGHGRVRRQQRTPFGVFASVSGCPECGGEGKVIANPCRACGGSRTRRGRERLSFAIPPGTVDGQYTVEGKGEFVPGGRSGDLIVDVTVEPHRTFKRDGANLHYDLEIDMVDAVLGGKFTVPTLDGFKDIKVEAGTQPNTIVRIRGRGVPYHNSGRGDLYVRTVVTIPQNTSREQRKLLKRFREARG